jgi:hypothetical protein
MGLLNGLIERVIYTPSTEGCEVELVGDIASMVEMAVAGDGKAASREAAGLGRWRRSVKLVAGRGFTASGVTRRPPLAASGRTSGSFTPSHLPLNQGRPERRP